jgi:hypothetical protein
MEQNRKKRISNGTHEYPFYLKGGEFGYLFVLRGRRRTESWKFSEFNIEVLTPKFYLKF